LRQRVGVTTTEKERKETDKEKREKEGCEEKAQLPDPSGLSQPKV